MEQRNDVSGNRILANFAGLFVTVASLTAHSQIRQFRYAPTRCWLDMVNTEQVC